MRKKMEGRVRDFRKEESGEWWHVELLSEQVRGGAQEGSGLSNKGISLRETNLQIIYIWTTGFSKGSKD